MRRNLTPSRTETEQHPDFMYRRLVQCVTDYAIYMLSPEGIVTNWNAGAERFKGYKADEIIGQHFSRFYMESDRKNGLPERALMQARTQGKFEGEGWRLRKDGTPFWCHVVIDPVHDPDGRLIGYAKITRDLTEQKLHSDRMQEISRNLDLALDHMSQGLCLFSAERKLVLCNQRFRQMFHLSDESIPQGMALADVMQRIFGGSETAQSLLRSSPINGNNLTNPVDLRHDSITIELTQGDRVIAVAHRILPGGGVVSTMDDITERRRIEGNVIHLAHHDALTDLPNRVVLQGRLQALLQNRPGSNDDATGKDCGITCAVLYLDLDRFKPVNDSHGHLVGDALLRAVAQRIQRTLRPSDLVARLGGDEFVILQASCRSEADATALAERVSHELSLPFAIKKTQVRIGTSIGIALAPQDGSDPERLLRNADLALYRAKSDGRDCYRYYDRAMEASVEKRRHLEQDLRRALSAQQFELHYQPIVDLERNTVTGFEALLRWKSPTRGNMPPAEFIPFAEEIGLMPKIGDWVLETACREATQWPTATKVSVNLSPTQFRQVGLVENVLSTLAETGLPPERLELEITETAMIQDIEGAATILKQLRALGIHIALDDFGTGYSSLSFLRTLPFTRIKIDRSFIKDLDTKPVATAIVRAVTGLCNSLGVAVTAEGVESDEQARALRAERCMQVQGFWISQPRPATEIPAMLALFPQEEPDLAESEARMPQHCTPYLAGLGA